MRFLLIGASALALFASGCGESASDVADQVTAPDTILVVPSDTIGVLMGDSNYVFGTIGDAIYTREGNIVVLDETACCAKVFDPSGEYLFSLGRQGSGPGELLHPGGLVLLSDGSIGILDAPSGGLHCYHPDGSFDSLRIDFQGQPVPQWAWGVDNGAFVGAYSTNQVEDEVMMTSFIIGRWEDSPQPSVVYYENTFPFNQEDMAAFMENTIFSTAFAGDRDGTVYLTEISSSAYAIDVLNADGTLACEISRDMPRVEKSAAEIAEETALITAILVERGVPEYMIDYQPDPYRWMIQPQGLGADGEGRIWARNAAAEGAVMDVYSRSGEHLAVVILEGVMEPGDLNYLNVKVQPQGILAYSMQDPEFPRLFVIPMPDI